MEGIEVPGREGFKGKSIKRGRKEEAVTKSHGSIQANPLPKTHHQPRPGDCSTSGQDGGQIGKGAGPSLPAGHGGAARDPALPEEHRAAAAQDPVPTTGAGAGTGHAGGPALSIGGGSGAAGSERGLSGGLV